MTQEEKEKLAREYTAKDRAQEIDNNNGCYNDQQTYFAYLAGFKAAENIILERASEGFEEWLRKEYPNSYLGHGISEDRSRDAWTASKLSAQKEIDDLKIAYEELTDDKSGVIKELRKEIEELKLEIKMMKDVFNGR